MTIIPNLESKHFLELSCLGGCLGIIVSTQVFSLDKNIRDTLLSTHLQQSVLKSWTIIAHLVKFVDLDIDIKGFEEFLGLQAEWAVRLGENDNLEFLRRKMCQ